MSLGPVRPKLYGQKANGIAKRNGTPEKLTECQCWPNATGASHCEIAHPLLYLLLFIKQREPLAQRLIQHRISKKQRVLELIALKGAPYKGSCRYIGADCGRSVLRISGACNEELMPAAKKISRSRSACSRIYSEHRSLYFKPTNEEMTEIWTYIPINKQPSCPSTLPK